jgi:hypothetical protein
MVSLLFLTSCFLNLLGSFWEILKALPTDEFFLIVRVRVFNVHVTNEIKIPGTCADGTKELLFFRYFYFDLLYFHQ